MADSPELEMKRAIAQWLNDESFGVYKTVGSYAPSQRGIFTNGPTLPTTLDECIVLTSRKPIADGRADLVFPVQFFIRVNGNSIAAGNAAGDLWRRLDQRSNIPPNRNVSWAWEFSRLEFEPDTNGRSAVASTFYFRARR